MTTDFQIQGPTRVCAATGRELRTGETYHATLSDEAGKFVRKDFAKEAWSGTPTGTIASWTGRVPASHAPKKPKFNDELLLDCFNHLAENEEPSRVHFRYVVALLLMRRKRLKFEDIRQADDGSQVLLVRDAKGGARHTIADPRLTETEITAVQDEIFQVLGWE